jgi:hypothetical protein
MERRLDIVITPCTGNTGRIHPAGVVSVVSVAAGRSVSQNGGFSREAASPSGGVVLFFIIFPKGSKRVEISLRM